MENASKALIMAGGILIAILILTLLIYMTTATTRLAKTQDKKILAEQTAEFNREYEAYAKSRMYGTDVITAVNKAIDYNTKIGTDEKKYRINIILKLTQNFDRTQQIVKQYANGTIEYKEPEEIPVGTLKSGEYQLFEAEGSMKMDDEVIKFFKQGSSDTRTDKNDNKKITTTYTYSAITNFKRAIFECTDVNYSEITGRISSMTFQQI